MIAVHLLKPERPIVLMSCMSGFLKNILNILFNCCSKISEDLF